MANGNGWLIRNVVLPVLTAILVAGTLGTYALMSGHATKEALAIAGLSRLAGRRL